MGAFGWVTDPEFDVEGALFVVVVVPPVAALTLSSGEGIGSRSTSRGGWISGWQRHGHCRARSRRGWRSGRLHRGRVRRREANDPTQQSSIGTVRKRRHSFNTSNSMGIVLPRVTVSHFNLDANSDHAVGGKEAISSRFAAFISSFAMPGDTWFEMRLFPDHAETNPSSQSHSKSYTRLSGRESRTM